MGLAGCGVDMDERSCEVKVGAWCCGVEIYAAGTRVDNGIVTEDGVPVDDKVVVGQIGTNAV